MMQSPRWRMITPSRYEWERDALGFLRAGLPDHEPYRAWSNFEFQTPEGAIYEVDCLLLTKAGFWLVEVKSAPGRVRGDAGTWTWERDGRLETVDNPLLLANRKARALAGLLKRQAACFKKVPCPFLEAVIFLSFEKVELGLDPSARARVFLRDREADHPEGKRDGILAAVLHRKGPGLERHPRAPLDAPVARAIAQALDAVGVRPSQKKRRVGDYVLGKLLDEGPGYQDFVAEHASLKGIRTRVRRYLIDEAANEEERDRLRRAAVREFRTLQTLDHPGILAVRDFKDHEFGPALILHHDDRAIGLDHYLVTEGHRLGIDEKLDFLRQLADGVRYAHRKKVIHRGLSPKSVVVFRPADESRPVLKICYWQVSTREGSSTSFTGTMHVEELIDAPYLVYSAPESRLGDECVTEAADVFSLGAIAYRLLSGRPPASGRTELSRVLREGRGLDLSAVLDGTGRELQELVRRATHPDVDVRFATVDEFLEQLDRVEDELTTPEDLVHPLDARKGDRLRDGLIVERVLGKGSTARALLVRREDERETKPGQRYVLKVALTPENNARLREEGAVLRDLQSEYIVGFVDELEFDGTAALLLKTAGDQTLAEYLRQEGSLSLDLLERFGENLLQALAYLERMGQRHRDIKPENIGVVDYRKKRKQLVLFDFSLARAPLESIHVGTAGYLDPFLLDRDAARGRQPLWDESAERYAAAVTLHELATGVRPRWGDGRSSPAETDAELTLEVEQFDPSVRESLADFFRRALAREVSERFANAEEMLRAWRAVFPDERAKEKEARQGRFELGLGPVLEGIRLESPIVQLELSTRAENALDRIDVVTVRDLLSTPIRELRFMRGVGKKTLSEILQVVARLREKFPDVEVEPPRPAPEVDPASLTLEVLYRRVVGRPRGQREASRFEIRRLILGDHPEHFFRPEEWPTQTAVASRMDVTRARVGQVVGEDRARWLKDPGITTLRGDLLAELRRQGGVFTVDEVIAWVLARGHLEETPDETLRRYASVVARAAVEAEHGLAEPRFRMHRIDERVWIGLSTELVHWACRLGAEADRIARADPLLASSRAVQRLRALEMPPLPGDAPAPSDDRLLRLAVGASSQAALSPRQEIYPRDMGAERALRLGAGAVRALGLGPAPGGEVVAGSEFTPEDVRERIAARYPEAGALPDPPELTELLGRIGLEVSWDEERGVYRRKKSRAATTSGSTLLPRQPTARDADPTRFSPEVAPARQFEEQLRYRHRNGGYLVLTVGPSKMTQCESELLRRFDLERVSIDERLIALMREIAREKNVDWGVVRTADVASRDSRDWTNLLRLVAWAVERLQTEILSREGEVLLVHPGLLARYDQIGILETLRDEVGKEGRLRTCWVLVPGDEQSELPVLDGKEIPLLSPGQRSRVPREWIENRHRAAAEAS